MPEYLSPGVYVEETSFRSKSIEGVSTSTAGFVGPTRWGPVSGEPELITNLADFELYYGSLDDLVFTDQPEATPNYLAHGVRAFFEEGGQRLYVSRVFSFGKDSNGKEQFIYPHDNDGIPQGFYATADIPTEPLSLVARYPGAAGNILVTITARVGTNALLTSPKPGIQPGSKESQDPKNRMPTGLAQVQSLSLVHAYTPPTSRNPSGGDPLDGLYLAHWNAKSANPPQWELISIDHQNNLHTHSLSDLYNNDPNITIRPLALLVEVQHPTVSPQGIPSFGDARTLGVFGFDPRIPGTLTSTFVHQPTTHFEALTIPFVFEPKKPLKDFLPTKEKEMVNEADRETAFNTYTLAFATALLDAPPPGVSPLDPSILGALNSGTTKLALLRAQYRLTGGNDGALPNPANYEGAEQFEDFLNDPLQSPKNGLLAFESVDDISIVAAPGYSANRIPDDVFAIQEAVINHCRKMRYRVAVLDTPPQNLVSDALDFRNLTSSNYAALYYPWITILDPVTNQRLNLPPSGFVAGIYARNDTEHGVFKAPANEVVRLAIDFEYRINKAQQDVLNPQGVNCFRFFPGRGFLLWGARTISDDPEWKYISVRRYFAYLEHSIDRGTQWVVFENNSKQLWDNVRRTVEDFLLNEWKMGALMGDKPEQAYFVRCDLSTMTQNDLDNGRLICLIGVAVVKPAEFVIFRIGQKTATTN
jgi:phage tail sheath protein FI